MDVFLELTSAEIKEERELTVSGVLRWMIEPLSYMVVFAVFIGAIANRPQPAFLVFLLAALIPFRMFTESVNRSMTVVRAYSPIILNRIFPRSVLPPVVVAANTATFALSMILFPPFMILHGVPFQVTLLWVPVMMAITLLLSAAGAYLGALLGLYFPDFRGAAQNLIRVTLFVSTGLVSIDDVPGDRLPLLIKANPLSAIFDGFRKAIIAGRAPNEYNLLYPTAVALAALALGLYVYRRRQREFAKEV